MNALHIRALALELVREDLAGNRYSAVHQKRVQESARRFLTWAVKRGKGDLRSIGKQDILLYQKYLGQLPSKKTGELLARKTVEGHYQAVVRLFSLLYLTGAIPENPAHGLTMNLPDRGGYKRRPFTRGEINQVLENISTDTAIGFRDRTLFELIYSSGLRVSEVAGLIIGNLDLDKREMIVRGKYDRDRIVPFSDVARDFLASYLGKRIADRDDYVFKSTREGKPLKSMSISHRFKKLLRKRGLDRKELSTHSIRHSTATHLLDGGMDIRKVQELLGHKNIESTVIYTHVQTEGLAKIYRKYHPREHELFEILDETYIQRLESIMKDKYGRDIQEKYKP